MTRLLPLSLLALAACTTAEPVDSVDLERYDGLWYEIAKIPTVFETDCTNTTAEYAVQPDDTVTVVNRCNLGTLDGPVNEISGYAYATDSSNAELRLFLDGVPPATYLIIGLADTPAPDDYDWAVVGSDLPGFLWILNRTPEMDPAALADALQVVDDQGYDRDDLEYTLQDVN